MIEPFTAEMNNRIVGASTHRIIPQKKEAFFPVYPELSINECCDRVEARLAKKLVDRKLAGGLSAQEEEDILIAIKQVRSLKSL